MIGIPSKKYIDSLVWEGVQPHHTLTQETTHVKIFEHITCDQLSLRSVNDVVDGMQRVLYNCRYHSQPVLIEIPTDMVSSPMPSSIPKYIPFDSICGKISSPEEITK